MLSPKHLCPSGTKVLTWDSNRPHCSLPCIWKMSFLYFFSWVSNYSFVVVRRNRCVNLIWLLDQIPTLPGSYMLSIAWKLFHFSFWNSSFFLCRLWFSHTAFCFSWCLWLLSWIQCFYYIGLAKKFIQVFRKMLQKNPNELLASSISSFIFSEWVILFGLNKWLHHLSPWVLPSSTPRLWSGPGRFLGPLHGNQQYSPGSQAP